MEQAEGTSGLLEHAGLFIRKSGMITPGDCVIVSVSGGPDSVALFHLLHRLSGELAIRLHVFHMDHGLRGEASAEDSRFVEQLAGRLGVPCTVVRLEPGWLKRLGGSLQAGARAVRYRELAAMGERIGANRVALGHNRDDQAETVLMRFLRGAGTRGLAGIPPIRAQGGLVYVRPLLETSRREIEAYCKQNELYPRLDASNLKPDYYRNRLRLELLPHLAEAYNPAIVANLAQTAGVLRVEDQFLEELAAAALDRCRAAGEGVSLSGSVLTREPLAVSRRVVRLAARETVGPEFDLGLEPVTRVLEAAANPRGSQRLDLPGGLQVTVAYGICRFAVSEPYDDMSSGEWPLAIPGENTIPELGLRMEARTTGEPRGPLEAAFDMQLLPGPLAVRLRRPGDRIWPVGVNGSKKLQDILVDAKVPRPLRDRIPLLVSGSDVVWVIGHRLDRRFLATAESDRILFLKAETRDSGV
ncbi:MAG TPA: tRNA lysidine(34) synthetase TilS [Symbiobacteriaceae bacterium]|jgi:tRNA(Ile)-lysidine synthase